MSAISVIPLDRWIRCGAIAVWPGRRLVMVEDRTVALTPGELSVLMALVEAQGEPVSRETLTARSRQRPTARIRSRVVDTRICSLRKKLGERANAIETIRNVGYRFRRVDANGARLH